MVRSQRAALPPARAHRPDSARSGHDTGVAVVDLAAPGSPVSIEIPLKAGRRRASPGLPEVLDLGWRDGDATVRAQPAASRRCTGVSVASPRLRPLPADRLCGRRPGPGLRPPQQEPRLSAVRCAAAPARAAVTRATLLTVPRQRTAEPAPAWRCPAATQSWRQGERTARWPCGVRTIPHPFHLCVALGHPSALHRTSDEPRAHAPPTPCRNVVRVPACRRPPPRPLSLTPRPAQRQHACVGGRHARSGAPAPSIPCHARACLIHPSPTPRRSAPAPRKVARGSPRATPPSATAWRWARWTLPPPSRLAPSAPIR